MDSLERIYHSGPATVGDLLNFGKCLLGLVAEEFGALIGKVSFAVTTLQEPAEPNACRAQKRDEYRHQIHMGKLSH